MAVQSTVLPAEKVRKDLDKLWKTFRKISVERILVTYTAAKNMLPKLCDDPCHWTEINVVWVWE